MNDAAGEPFPIPVMHLRDAPATRVVRASLGLTLYLHEPLAWATDGVAAAFAAFLSCIPRGQLGWYATSRVHGWRPLDDRALADVQAGLAATWSRPRLRHLLRFRAVDHPGAPSCGFDYREVDPARGGGAGYLQIRLPAGDDALLRLALELTSRWPCWSALGGHLASWNEDHMLAAFRLLYAWCRRYIGLDVQRPDEMGRHVHSGLPGTSWLTFLGAPLLARLGVDPAALQARTWQHGVKSYALARGVLLRAGAAPSAGDLNTLSYPSAYVEVARHLAPYLIEDPPAFPGPQWQRGEQTAAWMRRFVAPRDWG